MGVSTAAAISFVVWMPVELVMPTAIGSSATHGYGTMIVLERSRPSIARPVDRERHDRVVDRDEGDRQVVGLRVADGDPDLAGVELDAAHVERVGRRRVAPDQVDERGAGRHEQPDDDGQQQHRRERVQAPADA